VNRQISTSRTKDELVSKGNGKGFPVTSHEEREGMGCWASSLTLTFGTTQTAEISCPRAGRTDTNSIRTHYAKVQMHSLHGVTIDKNILENTISLQ